MKPKEGLSKTCSYCLSKGNNICGCVKYKAYKENNWRVVTVN